MIQISVCGLVTAVQIYFMSEISDLKELLIVFVAMMVVDSVDKWVGLVFQIHLETYYEDVCKNKGYLVFEKT